MDIYFWSGVKMIRKWSMQSIACSSNHTDTHSEYVSALMRHMCTSHRRKTSGKGNSDPKLGTQTSPQKPWALNPTLYPLIPVPGWSWACPPRCGWTWTWTASESNKSPTSRARWATRNTRNTKNTRNTLKKNQNTQTTLNYKALTVIPSKCSKRSKRS